jgi:branched-subunit amino acid transport protein
MTSYSDLQIWLIILALGLGTFLIRFSFLGVVGNRDLPPFVLRLLRYTAVAVIPGLVAPLVAWPAATGGQADPARIIAATVALGLGVAFRNVLLSIFGGAATLFAAQLLLG